MESPVDRVVADVLVVTDKQDFFRNDIHLYEVLVTRGIVFVFEDGHELSIEKDIWFSEDIIVERGDNLIQRFASTGQFEEGWCGGYVGVGTREVASVKD